MRRRNQYLLHIWRYIVPTLPFSLESVVSLLNTYCFHLFRPHSHYYALLLTIITLLPCYLLTLFPVTLLPGCLEKPETGIRNRKGNGNRNRNRKQQRNRNSNVKGSRYKNRDIIYFKLFLFEFNLYKK